jgi:hypothetical protein
MEVGRMDHDLEQQAQRINQHVAFAPTDFLAAVEAPWTAVDRRGPPWPP